MYVCEGNRLTQYFQSISILLETYYWLLTTLIRFRRSYGHIFKIIVPDFSYCSSVKPGCELKKF